MPKPAAAQTKHARMMTRDQRQWCRAYQRDTGGFEPMMQRAEFDDGKINFEDFAKANLTWFESWALETRQKLEDGLYEITYEKG